MTTAAPSSAWKQEPFRFGTPEQFGALRDLFRRARYTHPALCERMEIGTIYDFKQTREGRSFLDEVNDAQSLCVRLFLDAEDVSWSLVRSFLSAPDLALLEHFGLVETPEYAPDHCTATVLLYPTEELLIVSDRNVDPERSRVAPPADVVYPAITKNTQRFVGLMPRTRCDRFLELCSGTGIAALLAAQNFAREAWAIDITERATMFARFNAALNGLSNVTTLAGDLFDPVRGQRFDRIVAHPPYMPALQDQYIFRDGGEDGERVSWRIFQQLPEYLNPGGEFYCDCLTTDRENAPIEERIREAMGDAGREFDVLVAQTQTYDPVAYYAEMAKNGSGTFDSVGKRWEVFQRLGVRALVFGSILLRRRADGRAGVVVRRQLAPHTSTADLVRMLDWKNRTADWGPDERRKLLDAKLRTNAATQLRTVHRLQGGQWSLEGCMLATPHPFTMEAACPRWFPQLLAWLDGELRAREHLQHLKDTGMVAEGASDDEFAEMLYHLLDGGFATLEE
jgi:SAM-dependent methyltransferase